MRGGGEPALSLWEWSEQVPGLAGEGQGGADPRVIPKVLNLVPAEQGLGFAAAAGVSTRGYEQSPGVREGLCGPHAQWYLAMASLRFPCQRGISRCL